MCKYHTICHFFCVKTWWNKKNVIPLHPHSEQYLVSPMYGEMVEWSITPVLKTGVLRGTGGSNPSLSASDEYWRSTQVAIRGSPAKGVDWVYRCVGSNPTFSAKQPGIVEIPGCFHASSIPLEAAPQHQKPSEIWKNFLRLPPN